jgi:hypothetical protein
MPSGSDLKRNIGRALDFRGNPVGVLRGDENLHAMLRERFGNDVRPHYAAAVELSRTIQDFHFDSIDEVLHWFSSNPQIVALGKAAVVREILAAERLSAISSPMVRVVDAARGQRMKTAALGEERSQRPLLTSGAQVPYCDF